MRLFVADVRRRSDDGFILVAVLWILGALATLASIYAIYVRNTASSLEVNDDRIVAEAAVSAALELTAYRLTAVDQDVRPTRGAFSFRVGPANTGVRFRSEAARIDLNLAPKELLAGLFAALGAGSSDAQYYADRILGWRTPAKGGAQDSEVAAYQTAGLSYYPRQAPFPSVEELSLVLGLPPALAERATPFLTVFSGRPDVNVLDAEPAVIAALPGMTPDRLYSILGQREATGSQNPKLTMELLGPAKSGATLEGSQAMRVGVRVDFDNGRRVQAEVVILLLGDATADEPFRVLAWQDDFDGPT